MKKTIRTSKKVLSLFMAVLMIATIFTFAIPAGAICADGKHKYTGWTIDLDPTYIKEGHAFRQCIKCNYIYDYVIPAMGGEFDCKEHDFTTGTSDSDYKILIQPTCHSTGVKAHFCKNCGETNGVQSFVEIPVIAHTFGMTYLRQKATCVDIEITYHICSVCGLEEEMYDGALGHAWNNWELTFKGTCKEEAYETRTCRRCGEVEKNELHVLGSHTMVKDAYVAPTCTKEGLSFGLHCSTCGYVSQKQEVLEKLPHVDLKRNKVSDEDKDKDEGPDLLCDVCGTPIDCSCLCHNTAGFGGVIYRIVLFFWRLFGVARECKCGVEHYTVYKPAGETPAKP